MAANGDKKIVGKGAIAQFIAESKSVSKSDIAQKFDLSMPTVLQKVRDLVEDGVVMEVGEYQSTGGRKARALSVAGDRNTFLGINISKNHFEAVAVALNGDILCKERRRFAFENTDAYCVDLRRLIDAFITQYSLDQCKIAGVGFSVPGIVDREKDLLIRSHTLGLENFSLKRLSSRIPYPVIYDNDANCAAHSEPRFRSGTAVYLSLNNTLGGAFSVDGVLYAGSNNKSSEFGHMILVPDGKPCYCGKRGCADSYCAARCLSEDNLEQFFEELKNGDQEKRDIWNGYLRHLAIAVTNIRTIYDCDIILGGYVGGYLQEYLLELGALSMKYNNFDLDASFLSCGRYGLEASSYGAALKMQRSFFEKMQ